MKKKLKGLLSLWLAVVLVLGTPTVPVLAAGTDHGEHTNDAGWESCNSFAGNLLEKNYYLSNIESVSNGTVVSGNTTICLNGRTLYSGDISVTDGGTLTMDDCTGNGSCEVPFEVKSGCVLNLKGGEYNYYNKSIKVNDGGTLNIGDENGGISQGVRINLYNKDSNAKNIKGDFKLIMPNSYYFNSGEVTKVFAWYVNASANSYSD